MYLSVKMTFSVRKLKLLFTSINSLSHTYLNVVCIYTPYAYITINIILPISVFSKVRSKEKSLRKGPKLDEHLTTSSWQNSQKVKPWLYISMFDLVKGFFLIRRYAREPIIHFQIYFSVFMSLENWTFCLISFWGSKSKTKPNKTPHFAVSIVRSSGMRQINCPGFKWSLTMFSVSQGYAHLSVAS